MTVELLESQPEWIDFAAYAVLPMAGECGKCTTLSTLKLVHFIIVTKKKMSMDNLKMRISNLHGKPCSYIYGDYKYLKGRAAQAGKSFHRWGVMPQSRFGDASSSDDDYSSESDIDFGSDDEDNTVVIPDTDSENE